MTWAPPPGGGGGESGTPGPISYLHELIMVNNPAPAPSALISQVQHAPDFMSVTLSPTYSLLSLLLFLSWPFPTAHSPIPHPCRQG